MKVLTMTTLLFIFVASWVYPAQATKPITPAPKTLSTVGGNSVEFEPTFWPDFYAFSSDNPSCEAYLRDTLSLTRKSGFDGTQYRQVLSYDFDFAGQGLEAYRKTSKILITFTLRVEGYKEIIKVWPDLCHPWHGKSYQKFPEGDVIARLYVNGVQYTEATLTMPGAGQGVSIEPNDPTQTGSVVLTPDDFGGEFPSQLNIEVKWYNDTSMRIKSPAGMRNLIVTITPIT